MHTVFFFFKILCTLPLQKYNFGKNLGSGTVKKQILFNFFPHERKNICFPFYKKEGCKEILWARRKSPLPIKIIVLPID